MKASEINVRSINSSSECYNLIDSIYADHRNVQGGISAFMSGKTTYLTKTAQNKVDALERRAMSFTSEDI